jgi:protocatechuate 3,4-dioxygenase beta subunit
MHIHIGHRVETTVAGSYQTQKAQPRERTLTDKTRRRLLMAGAGTMLLAPLGALARALEPTPRQPAGPFYPTELPLDDDSDLTRVAGRDAAASGRITDLTGRVVDVQGRPLEGHRVEIWQCDANGRYRHPRDPGTAAPDPGFQGHGRSRTDGGGRYRFRTIRPVPYPGRTPHIHVAVFPPEGSPFVTQLYVEGEPGNAEDFLYRRVPADRRHLITVPFEPGGDTGAELAARFEIVLGATPEG